MYTSTYGENARSLHITFPVKRQEIERAKIETRPWADWIEARIEIFIEYNYDGVRYANIGLYAHDNSRDVDGNLVWKSLSLKFSNRSDKAFYQRLLKYLARDTLGEAVFTEMMEQIKGSFRDWTD